MTMAMMRGSHIPVGNGGGASRVGEEEVGRGLVCGEVGDGALARVQPTLDDEIRAVERGAVVYSIRNQLADV